MTTVEILETKLIDIQNANATVWRTRNSARSEIVELMSSVKKIAFLPTPNDETTSIGVSFYGKDDVQRNGFVTGIKVENDEVIVCITDVDSMLHQITLECVDETENLLQYIINAFHAGIIADQKQ